ncbi:MAG: murein transglycosylase A [Proteobacteria bacterium]|nr:murein transglycosylase A [Pseudomonadota bacterium]
MIKKYTRLYLAGFVAIIFILAWGCAVFSGKEVSRKASLKKLFTFQYPEFTDDMSFDGLDSSILMSLSYLDKVSEDRNFEFGKDVYTAKQMKQSLLCFMNFINTHPAAAEINQFIKKSFYVYKSTGNKKKKVLFTGYYEPVLKGSLNRTPVYQYPIYEKPGDHTIIDLSLFSPEFKGKKIIGRFTDNTVVPYYERKEIEDMALFRDAATPICWVSDQTDLFFLQIQGSGKICLQNGDMINVHYHTTNGHPYRSIGKLLIEEGKIDQSQISMQKIKDYITHHPDEQAKIFNTNPSYVFFKREVDGPFGCLEVKLTPGRSAATDRRLFPDAALMFIRSHKPVLDGDGNIDAWIPFERFTLNQDTGGAIKGPGRCDLFCGNDKYAEIAAGNMRHEGDMYFFILKPGPNR